MYSQCNKPAWLPDRGSKEEGYLTLIPSPDLEDMAPKARVRCSLFPSDQKDAFCTLRGLRHQQKLH